MTQPPDGPDEPSDPAGYATDASVRRLYPVPDAGGFIADDADLSAPPGGADAAAAAGSRPAAPAPPWGNTPEELLDEALQQLHVLTQRIDELDQLISADRHDQDGTGAGKHLRFRYERHPAADAAAAHAELAKWVSWLVATYQLTDAIPACWDRHDALAEELAGFYVAWQNVWVDEGRYDAAVLWHDQLHKAAGARWAVWLRGARCTETCALDTAFAAQAHRRWSTQAAAAGGADYRLARTRQLAPPIPPTPKSAPAKNGKPSRSTKAPASSPTTGRTRP
ncbi:hypothetical protein [Nakamurella endophytica]|uniref:DUF4913 domain-containing protein n=1 Tax=Nakamurella endophytica TaxID=1748367 RepID=A0A917T3V7_9ACTN|nr:hypothetical protein [Nakamurella endophytica]GGM09949.1 hypothetical protein GCM10011594_32310 [Nakamurella endophytica]